MVCRNLSRGELFHRSISGHEGVQRTAWREGPSEAYSMLILVFKKLPVYLQITLSNFQPLWLFEEFFARRSNMLEQTTFQKDDRRIA
jgi:hypothetical protein